MSTKNQLMKIFISHSSSDKRFVRLLKSDLQENGFDTFVDEDCLDLGDSLKERLELELDAASHFLIILSKNAVNSDWVKFELSEALHLFEAKTLNKIIPVVLRKCEMPEELKKLLYEDLSSDFFQIDGDKVKPLTEGYSAFLIKLFNTLRSNEKKLNKKDLAEFKKEVSKSDTKNQNKNPETITQRHKVISYKDKETATYYKRKIAEFKKSMDYEHYNPVMLPKVYNLLITDLQLGDILTFTLDDVYTADGHFAGFRGDDNTIVLPYKLRDFLKVEKGLYYGFRMDLQAKKINVIY